MPKRTIILFVKVLPQSVRLIYSLNPTNQMALGLGSALPLQRMSHIPVMIDNRQPVKQMIQLWSAQVCPGRLIPQRTHSPPILEQALKFGLMIYRCNDDIRCCVQPYRIYILAKTYRLLSHHTLSANSPCQT